MSETKQLSVRMPLDLVQRLTAKGKTSPYIVEAVREKIERDEKMKVEASLLCLANDDDANDISDFAAAQARVMARGD